MSARIALDPINTGLPTISDYRSRSAGGDSWSDSPAEPQAAPSTDSESTRRSAGILPPLPEPAAPPGATFAVAVISGKLPQRPVSGLEARLRLGASELPAYGSLALTDRLV